MARKKKVNIVDGISAEEARLQHEAVVAAQAEENAAQEGKQAKHGVVDPERAKKIEKQAKRMSKIEDAAEKAKKRIEDIAKAAQDCKSKRVRKYENVKVKVPYDRKILNFTTPELMELFGGWFTLTYAFSQPVRTDVVNKDGSPVMRDYYICSRDVSSIPPSLRPKKNAAIKKLFDKDVYGYAIIAPASAFGGKDKEEEE